MVQAGTLDQKVYPTKVVRRDREADLALLRAEGASDLPALPLGSADDLGELQEVFVFGFPFGRGPANRSEEYPSISINQGAISSLRRKDRQLTRIQLNASVNPGNSGGPILDTRGRVAGVVVGRIEANIGAGLDLAILVNLVGRFLARPDVIFLASRSEAVKPGEPVDFGRRSTSGPNERLAGPRAGHGGRNPVGASGRDERVEGRVPGAGGPVSRVRGRRRSRSSSNTPTVRCEAGSRTARSGSATWRVKLSELGVVRLGPKPEVHAADGQRLDGAPVMPEELTLAVGGQAIRLDLRKAVAIDPADDESATVVGCTLVLRRGKEAVEVASLPVFSVQAPHARASRHCATGASSGPCAARPRSRTCDSRARRAITSGKASPTPTTKAT